MRANVDVVVVAVDVVVNVAVAFGPISASIIVVVLVTVVARVVLVGDAATVASSLVFNTNNPVAFIAFVVYTVFILGAFYQFVF